MQSEQDVAAKCCQSIRDRHSAVIVYRPMMLYHWSLSMGKSNIKHRKKTHSQCNKNGQENDEMLNWISFQCIYPEVCGWQRNYSYSTRFWNLIAGLCKYKFHFKEFCTYRNSTRKLRHYLDCRQLLSNSLSIILNRFIHLINNTENLLSFPSVFNEVTLALFWGKGKLVAWGTILSENFLTSWQHSNRIDIPALFSRTY